MPPDTDGYAMGTGWEPATPRVRVSRLLLAWVVAAVAVAVVAALLPGIGLDRPAPGGAVPVDRARAPLLGDRRPRPPGAARRDARRECPEHGALAVVRRLPPGRVGARPVVPDRGQPGGHPARVQRGYAGLPLGREGARAADGVPLGRRL